MSVRSQGPALTGPSSADVVSDGAVFQRDGEIIEVGGYEDLKNRHPDAEVIGSSNYVVMPGLVDGHSHMGLTPCQIGALDNALELRSLHKLGSRRIDPYLDQMYCAIQMIENGTTTVQALHTGIQRAGPEGLPRDRYASLLRSYGRKSKHVHSWSHWR